MRNICRQQNVRQRDLTVSPGFVHSPYSVFSLIQIDVCLKEYLRVRTLEVVSAHSRHRDCALFRSRLRTLTIGSICCH